MIQKVNSSRESIPHKITLPLSMAHSYLKCAEGHTAVMLEGGHPPLSSDLDYLSDTLEEAILSILQVILPLERMGNFKYLITPVNDTLEFILNLQDEVRLMSRESASSPLPSWRTDDLELDISDSIQMVTRILALIQRQIGYPPCG
jgi:hypothetical protein